MLRPGKKFPHVWCPGCGHGIVQGAIIRAVQKLGWSRDEMVMVSGIGCSSRMPVYVDFNSLHTAHGRAIAFATGVKLHNPKLHVIVITGDGDALAIGGNHFIHACRRNADLTVILMNNNIYGMTGGQYSPTTPIGKRASTASYGTAERDFDPCALAQAAGAAAQRPSPSSVASTPRARIPLERTGTRPAPLSDRAARCRRRRRRPPARATPS